MKHPLIRYHGGKWRIAQKIIEEFPPHTTYVEPFGGAGSVLFQKPRSKYEVYNDIDGEIVNVFKVLREHGEKLKELLDFTPFSREEWKCSRMETNDPIEMARRTIVRAAMSFGSAGSTKNTSSFRSCKYSAKTWADYTETILKFADRLKGVVIENTTATEIIDMYDDEETLFYLDPPYLPSTRNMSGSKCYRYELNDSDHEKLLKKIKNIKGMAIISGYENVLYNDILTDWKKVKIKARALGYRGTVMRTEILWISQKCESKKCLFGIKQI